MLKRGEKPVYARTGHEKVERIMEKKTSQTEKFGKVFNFTDSSSRQAAHKDQQYFQILFQP